MGEWGVGNGEWGVGGIVEFFSDSKSVAPLLNLNLEKYHEVVLWPDGIFALDYSPLRNAIVLIGSAQLID